MQKLYIVFISSVLIVSNNFGMDFGALNEATKKFFQSYYESLPSCSMIIETCGSDSDKVNKPLIKKPLIFEAMDECRFEQVSTLLKNGVGINTTDHEGNTLLHYAVEKNDRHSVEFLLFNGANIFVINKNYVSAFQVAMMCNNHNAQQAVEDYSKIIQLKSLDLLAHNGEKLKNIIRLNKSGYCSKEIIEAQKSLQEYKPEMWEVLRRCTFYDPTVVMLARFISQRSKAKEELLEGLKNGAYFSVNNVLLNNPYVLHAYEGEEAFDGASVLFAEQFLKTASSAFTYPIIKELLYGGYFDLNVCNDEGESLLCQLTKSTTDYIKYRDFLASGVAVNTVDTYGKIPLSYAVELNDEIKINRLLQYGAVVHTDMLKEKSSFLGKAFDLQQCFSCGIHPENMSNIPCINQHIGMFICKDCYNKSNAQCPLCRRSLDEYGK